jgi:Bacterial type II and III secretion system protein
MHRSIKFALLFLLISGATALANAQSPSSPSLPLKHYKVDFLVKEADASGHITNSRSYSTILATTNSGQTNQIRSGNRIPIRVTSTGESSKGADQIAYIDVGVNIDCSRVQEIDQRLAMTVKAEISSIPPGTDLNSGLDPIIRQFQWNSDVLILPSVPTTIFSSDDVNSKTKMQVEVTATPIK